MGERRAAHVGFVGLLLMVLGVAAFGAARLASGVANHSYSSDPLPPATVSVTRSHEYQLSYVGGVAALAGQGIEPGSLECTWEQPGNSAHSLAIDPEPGGTTWRRVIATFVAPVSGRVMVSCDHLGAVFVDDADDTGADLAGWFTVLATLALAGGVVLCLAQLRNGIGWPEARDPDQLSGRVAP